MFGERSWVCVEVGDEGARWRCCAVTPTMGGQGNKHHFLPRGDGQISPAPNPFNEAQLRIQESLPFASFLQYQMTSLSPLPFVATRREKRENEKKRRKHDGRPGDLLLHHTLIYPATHLLPYGYIYTHETDIDSQTFAGFNIRRDHDLHAPRSTR